MATQTQSPSIVGLYVGTLLRVVTAHMYVRATGAATTTLRGYGRDRDAEYEQKQQKVLHG